MGIPKFFRWLTRRYPLILQKVEQEENCPPSDNLYLDLNGIVHNCIHGNDQKKHERISKLEDFEEVWANIMKAIDEIVHIVKPQKILFMAVDGVAPRAKMNQQRARRFRSARDSMLLKETLQKQGKDVPDFFDSNAISPGTKFMADLCKQLEFFVKYKLNTDPLYQKLKIVLSDGTVPGEGEHKMMDYIRQIKLQKDYDPNTRHVFYGADADLIMLSLLTHEPHFMIIREEHIVRKIKQGGVQRLDLQKTNEFQLVHISLLREYFHLEYTQVASSMMMRYDLERIIDDFVFFCFFIGNDFLPSLSALDISEGSLDFLIDFYKQCLPSMSNYITENGKIFWDRAEPFIRLLGLHENEVFIDRLRQIDNRREKIVSWDPEFANTMGAKVNKSVELQQRLKHKLREKKIEKITLLKLKNGDKRYKKFLLIKKFTEDSSQTMNQGQLKHRDDLLLKYKAIQEKQLQSEKEEDRKIGETLEDIIHGLKEEYFSDLQPDEIPDEDVGDIDESEINTTDQAENEEGEDIEAKIAVLAELNDKSEQTNLDFMREFIKRYSHDSNDAKAFYYKQKLDIDMTTESGIQQRQRLLKKYLEGLQWVLYYYYKGAQHWRWFYPYHYAPMISDMGQNICANFLDGNVNIEHFEIDENCSQINHPYTPFQQLLSILPHKSIFMLPKVYGDLAFGELASYFPSEFEIDLNGKTLSWEAICLIPFVDEHVFLEAEKRQNRELELLNPEDQQRNLVVFDYKSYYYDENQKNSQDKKVLKSTLTSLKDLPYDYVSSKIHSEYSDVGKYSFTATLDKKVIVPCYDFPSFKWLNVINIEYEEVLINRVPFKICLAKIPSCKEESDPEELEKFVYEFVNLTVKELYIDFPWLNEGFPLYIESRDTVYQIYGDVYTNNYRVKKLPQEMPGDKWDDFSSRKVMNLVRQGFLLSSARVLVTISKVKQVGYDSNYCQHYKEFFEERDHQVIPLSMIVRKRDPLHYLNISMRTQNLAFSFNLNEPIICLNMTLFGVMGKIDQIFEKRGDLKVEFNRDEEEAKLHDPFVAQTVLKQTNSQLNLQSKKSTGPFKSFLTDTQIEEVLNLRRGVINKLTSSVLITYTDPQSKEKQVLDLGLNVKNFTKKVHIPDYVRFIGNEEEVAINQYDDYTHNTHARGARHVSKHWEYAEECVDFIVQYQKLYPEVFQLVSRTLKDKKGMSKLKDLYKGLDEQLQIQKVKELTKWVEGLPISHLPYVDMGFDALAPQTIKNIDEYQTAVRQTYQKVQLRCRNYEFLQQHMVYQEHFPFWSSPFIPKDVDDFRAGDRVININSTKREYIPFGFRGTVIGKTNDKVIVLFDEQYLNGGNAQGHCPNYRGGFVKPYQLINLTRKFLSIQHKNPQVSESFQEIPFEGREVRIRKDIEESKTDPLINNELEQQFQNESKEEYKREVFYKKEQQQQQEYKPKRDSYQARVQKSQSDNTQQPGNNEGNTFQQRQEKPNYERQQNPKFQSQNPNAGGDQQQQQQQQEPSVQQPKNTNDNKGQGRGRGRGGQSNFNKNAQQFKPKQSQSYQKKQVQGGGLFEAGGQNYLQKQINTIEQQQLQQIITQIQQQQPTYPSEEIKQTQMPVIEQISQRLESEYEGKDQIMQDEVVNDSDEEREAQNQNAADQLASILLSMQQQQQQVPFTDDQNYQQEIIPNTGDFTQDPSLTQNADIQQLFNLMNLASQMQSPLSMFGAPLIQPAQPIQSNLDLNAPTFVPAPKKKEEESKKNEQEQ